MHHQHRRLVCPSFHRQTRSKNHEQTLLVALEDESTVSLIVMVHGIPIFHPRNGHFCICAQAPIITHEIPDHLATHFDGQNVRTCGIHLTHLAQRTTMSLQRLAKAPSRQPDRLYSVSEKSVMNLLLEQILRDQQHTTQTFASSVNKTCTQFTVTADEENCGLFEFGEVG
jgi:hypothetical protein